MSDAIYDWYRSTIKQIKVWRENIEEGGEGAEEKLRELTDAINTMELACPGLKERHDRLTRIQDTFTAEQIDFICYQIGDWYLMWKGCLTEEYVPHRLGFAKEQLKSMICGE